MKLFKTVLCAAAASLAMGGVASAAEWSFNAGAATDYVFRGIDQSGPWSDENQIFGGADVTFGMDNAFYAGSWVSNTGTQYDNGVEYDLYTGWKSKLGGANIDLGLIFYGYNNSEEGDVSDNSNTFEVKAAASIPAGSWTYGGAVYYSNDYAGSNEASTYVEANLAYTLKSGPTLSAAVGNFSSDCCSGSVGSYSTFNFGVTVPVTEKVSLDARYIGVTDDASHFGSKFDGFVATVKATF